MGFFFEIIGKRKEDHTDYKVVCGENYSGIMWDQNIYIII